MKEHNDHNMPYEKGTYESRKDLLILYLKVLHNSNKPISFSDLLLDNLPSGGVAEFESIMEELEAKKWIIKTEEAGHFISGLPFCQTIKKSYSISLDGVEYLTSIGVIDDKYKSNIMKSKVNPNLCSNKEIFIVHGMDNEAKIEVARFLEKLQLKPIILHEQVNAGKTIIEKIESYSNVAFGIVLYTPCDKCYAKEENAKPLNRARQNVVFEHGYLIGKIGRDNVCALMKGDVEPPNDISGVVYTIMDKEGSWRMKIAQEIKNAGLDIDLNNLSY
jgi:predicted nucleotide-binding protein